MTITTNSVWSEMLFSNGTNFTSNHSTDTPLTSTPSFTSTLTSSFTTKHNAFNSSLAPICSHILYADIGNTRIRYWDLAILLPNLVYLAYLAVYVGRTARRLRRTSSHLFSAFYALVAVVVLVSVGRAVLAMTVNVTVTAGYVADKILWLILRFFLLATELSVVVFGLAFGHLESNKSIKYVLLVTFTIGFLYSSIQGILEFLSPSSIFHIETSDGGYDIFGHGGIVFIFFCSFFLFILYTLICILPFTQIRRYFSLPSKRIFYVYCGCLGCMNLLQCFSAGMMYIGYPDFLCGINVASYFYFAFYSAVVYRTFLFNFFRINVNHSLFAYKSHYDNSEDTVSLPRHLSDEGDPKFDVSVYEHTDQNRFANLQLTIDQEFTDDINGSRQMVNPVA